jgi:hypothetical protein
MHRKQIDRIFLRNKAFEEYLFLLNLRLRQETSLYRENSYFVYVCKVVMYCPTYISIYQVRETERETLAEQVLILTKD